jgi:hypothetical protein
LNYFVQALLAIAAGLFHLLAMRSTALPSNCYGNPEDVYAAKQAREKRQAQQTPKRPILTLKRKSSEEWSEARKRAEELFHPAADRS